MLTTSHHTPQPPTQPDHTRPTHLWKLPHSDQAPLPWSTEATPSAATPRDGRGKVSEIEGWWTARDSEHHDEQPLNGDDDDIWTRAGDGTHEPVRHGIATSREAKCPSFEHGQVYAALLPLTDNYAGVCSSIFTVLAVLQDIKERERARERAKLDEDISVQSRDDPSSASSNGVQSPED